MRQDISLTALHRARVPPSPFHDFLSSLFYFLLFPCMSSLLPVLGECTYRSGPQENHSFFLRLFFFSFSPLTDWRSRYCQSVRDMVCYYYSSFDFQCFFLAGGTKTLRGFSLLVSRPFFSDRPAVFVRWGWWTGEHVWDLFFFSSLFSLAMPGHNQKEKGARHCSFSVTLQRTSFYIHMYTYNPRMRQG